MKKKEIFSGERLTDLFYFAKILYRKIARKMCVNQQP